MGILPSLDDCNILDSTEPRHGALTRYV
jgi:hypothetical protein